MVFTTDANDERQLTGLRKTVVSESNADNCYRQFFVGNTPPIGFKSSTGHANNIRYICQGVCEDSRYPYASTSCFSTMFDLNYGIPIYSAYVVRLKQARLFGTAKRRRLYFRKEPGER